VTVIAEEIEALGGMQDRLVARIALYAFGAARHGSKNIVRVHGTQDQRRSVPSLVAEPADYRTSIYAFQAGHAHYCQELGASFYFHLQTRKKKYEQLHNERTSSFVTHLDAAFGVLARTEEKRAVDERIPIENRHPFFAKDTVHFGATLRCERWQDETACVIVSVVAFVFRLEEKQCFQWRDVREKTGDRGFDHFPIGNAGIISGRGLIRWWGRT
jgi:hypothetical protein